MIENAVCRWKSAFNDHPCSQLARTGLATTILVRELAGGGGPSLAFLQYVNELEHLILGQILRHENGSYAMSGEEIIGAVQELAAKFDGKQFLEEVLSLSVADAER